MKVAKLTWKKKMTSKNVSVIDSAGNTVPVTEPREERGTRRQYIESLYMIKMENYR